MQLTLCTPCLHCPSSLHSEPDVHVLPARHHPSHHTDLRVKHVQGTCYHSCYEQLRQLQAHYKCCLTRSQASYATTLSGAQRSSLIALVRHEWQSQFPAAPITTRKVGCSSTLTRVSISQPAPGITTSWVCVASCSHVLLGQSPQNCAAQESVLVFTPDKFCFNEQTQTPKTETTCTPLRLVYESFFICGTSDHGSWRA